MDPLHPPEVVGPLHRKCNVLVISSSLSCQFDDPLGMARFGWRALYLDLVWNLRTRASTIISSSNDDGVSSNSSGAPDPSFGEGNGPGREGGGDRPEGCLSLSGDGTG